MRLLADEVERQKQAEALAEDLISHALSFYSVNVAAVQPVVQAPAETADSWLVFTHEGVFRLYLQDATENTSTVLQVWQHLVNQGFSRLAPLLPASHGDVCVSLGGRLAYLAKEVDGRPCELAVQADAVEVGRCLGELHILSRDLLFSLQNALEHSRAAEPSLAVQREDLELFRTMAEHRLYPTGFDRLLIKIFGEAIRFADQCLEFLAQLSLDGIENSPCCSGLLLEDYRGRNFKVDVHGTVRLSLIRKVTWGPCIKDLAGVLDLIGERTDWDVAAASRVLDAYQDVRALQPGEQELMYALGTFPSRVWQVCCEYYKGRRNRSEPEAAEMLCREWENQIKRREYWQLLLGDVLGYENST
ncbi:MAG TPA: hypothetical protein GXX47_00390 [Firmicutes bacterium]|nr:hypothetical protein [Bacillota bacterium]